MDNQQTNSGQVSEFLSQFLEIEAVQDLIKNCEIRNEGYNMIKAVNITIRETGTRMQGSQLEIQIENNAANGVTEYKKTYSFKS